MKVVFIYDVCCIYKLICGVPGKSGRDQSRQDHDREPLTLFKYVHSNHTRDFCEPWEKQSSHMYREGVGTRLQMSLNTGSDSLRVSFLHHS